MWSGMTQKASRTAPGAHRRIARNGGVERLTLTLISSKMSMTLMPGTARDAAGIACAVGPGSDMGETNGPFAPMRAVLLF